MGHQTHSNLFGTKTCNYDQHAIGQNTRCNLFHFKHRSRFIDIMAMREIEDHYGHSRNSQNSFTKRAPWTWLVITLDWSVNFFTYRWSGSLQSEIVELHRIQGKDDCRAKLKNKTKREDKKTLQIPHEWRHMGLRENWEHELQTSNCYFLRLSPDLYLSISFYSILLFFLFWYDY